MLGCRAACPNAASNETSYHGVSPVTCPDHVEATAWGGAMDVADSGKKFEAGDMAGGMQLYERGVAALDRAVRRAPLNPGTRVPRAPASSGTARARTMALMMAPT